MDYRAYLDETEKDGIFALAGYVASAEKWDAFSAEWSRSLRRYGVLEPNNTYQFHMTEMSRPERKVRIEHFYRIIENHLSFATFCAFRISDIEAARKRVSFAGYEVDLGPLAQPYHFAFHFLMEQFHLNRSEMAQWVPPDCKVGFYFDEKRTEERGILRAWGRFLGNQPATVQAHYGNAPRFVDDNQHVPVQAADFLVWHIREACSRANPGAYLRGGLFGDIKTKKSIFHAGHFVNQDMAVDIISNLAQSAAKFPNTPPNRV